jgi:hypothetical protein
MVCVAPVPEPSHEVVGPMCRSGPKRHVGRNITTGFSSVLDRHRWPCPADGFAMNLSQFYDGHGKPVKMKMELDKEAINRGVPSAIADASLPL